MSAATSAPNLSALVGPEVAQKLLDSAGGLKVLVTMQGSAVRSVGREAFEAEHPHLKNLYCGWIGEADVVQEAVQRGGGVGSHMAKFVKKVADVLARKAALMANADFTKQSIDGSGGSKMKVQMATEVEELALKMSHDGDKLGQAEAKPMTEGDYGKTQKRGGRKVQMLKTRKANRLGTETVVEQMLHMQSTTMTEEEQKQKVLHSRELQAQIQQEDEKREKQRAAAAAAAAASAGDKRKRGGDDIGGGPRAGSESSDDGGYSGLAGLRL